MEFQFTCRGTFLDAVEVSPTARRRASMPAILPSESECSHRRTRTYSQQGQLYAASLTNVHRASLAMVSPKVCSVSQAKTQPQGDKWGNSQLRRSPKGQECADHKRTLAKAITEPKDCWRTWVKPGDDYEDSYKKSNRPGDDYDYSYKKEPTQLQLMLPNLNQPDYEYNYNKGNQPADDYDYSYKKEPSQLQLIKAGRDDELPLIDNEIELEEDKTTLMIRNIPCSFSLEKLGIMIDGAGFAGLYDWLHIPSSRHKKIINTNLGYAFINFIDVKDSNHFASSMNGTKFVGTNSSKLMSISVANVQYEKE